MKAKYVRTKINNFVRFDTRLDIRRGCAEAICVCLFYFFCEWVPDSPSKTWNTSQTGRSTLRMHFLQVKVIKRIDQIIICSNVLSNSLGLVGIRF